MTKIITPKDAIKKQEKKQTLVDDAQPMIVSEAVKDNDDKRVEKTALHNSIEVQEKTVVKEKLKREKNTMPKKTAKKEQELNNTLVSDMPSVQEVPQISTSQISPEVKEEKVVLVSSSPAPLTDSVNSKEGVTIEAKEATTSIATSEHYHPKPKNYSQPHHQQNQQQNKKFNKKQYSKHPHSQSSHYQNQNSQQSSSGHYSERYGDGYQKSKEDHSPKQPLTREQLEEMSLQDLYVHAKRNGVVGAVLMSHKTLVEKILEMQQDPDREILVEGVLEKLPDGFGFLRSARFDYVSSPDDIYVSPAQIRKMGLRTGDTICGTIRRPKDNEKYFALARIDKVNFSDPAKLHERPHFDRLSPMHPNKKFTLEYLPHYVSTRIMDIFTPIGKGQRGLIVAPPKAGKTVLSKEIAQSLIANHPEIFLIMLLIDERPEEVADMKRFVKGAHAEVISSTFDEPAERHVQVAEAVLEKAKRLVEVGKDVVIFLDSVTRLARAYNTVAPASGKILTGGVDANSLQRPKRFFGAARCLEEGGSLTILGSALIETGSRMDEVIYEEFKGTGNMEIHMSRKLSNRRIYPAFDLLVSGTRRDELLQSEEELNRSWVLQKFLANMNTAEAMEFLLDKMKKFKTNEEFFESMNPKKASNGNGSNGNGK